MNSNHDFNNSLLHGGNTQLCAPNVNKKTPNWRQIFPELIQHTQQFLPNKLLNTYIVSIESTYRSFPQNLSVSLQLTVKLGMPLKNNKLWETTSTSFSSGKWGYCPRNFSHNTICVFFLYCFHLMAPQIIIKKNGSFQSIFSFVF